MVKTKKLFKIAIVTLSIVAVSIIILAVWISRDDYVPKKLGNSVSAALNNRYGSSCSIAENDKYIFYVNQINNDLPLYCINKHTGEKKLIENNVGNRDSSVLFVHKKSIIYTKAKGKGYYDVYSCNFEGKNKRLIKKKCNSLHMVIDDWLYVPNDKGALSRVSLINGKEQIVNNKICERFIGINKKDNNLYFDKDFRKIIAIKINNRRTKFFLKNQSTNLSDKSWIGKAKNIFGILGVNEGELWLLGDNGHSLCSAKIADGKWKTKVIIGKAQGISFLLNSALEKNKVYYMNSDETTVYMYDINTGKSSEIYRTTNKNIKVLAAIGDNILISEWKKDDNHVNYYESVEDKSARHYYINNSGKVLYELD